MVQLTDDQQPHFLAEMSPRFEFAFDMRIVTGPISRLKGVNGSANDMLMMTIDGGDVSGPRIRGRVLPGGTEWPLVQTDGVSRIDARYAFVCDDGAVIGVHNTGLRRGPPDVMERLLARREVVDARTYYMRTWSRFDAPAGPHQWLGQSVFVGIGERHPELLHLRYYEMT